MRSGTTSSRHSGTPETSAAAHAIERGADSRRLRRQRQRRYRRAMSFLFRKSVEMPTAETALPGRSARSSSPAPTSCSTLRSPRRSRRASSGSSSGWGASGAPSASTGRPRASTPPRWDTPAASPRTRHTKRCARAARGTRRSCSPSSIPAKTSYEEMLRIFWEGHDPTQGMRQGNDVGTQYRSAIYWHDQRQFDLAVATRDMYDAELRRAGYGRDDGHPRGRAVLLRRGLPPAVPRGEPERVATPVRQRQRRASHNRSPLRASCPAGLLVDARLDRRSSRSGRHPARR